MSSMELTEWLAYYELQDEAQTDEALRQRAMSNLQQRRGY